MKFTFELPFNVEIVEKWETAHTRAFSIKIDGVLDSERFYSVASVQRRLRDMIHRDVEGMGFGLASTLARSIMFPYVIDREELEPA